MQELKKTIEKNNNENIDNFVDKFYTLFKTSGIQEDISDRVKAKALKYAKVKVEETFTE